MKTTASVEIDRPIEDVFDLTIHHVAEWSDVVIEDQIIEETPDVVGTTFRSITENQGEQMVFEGVVTQYQYPNLNAIQLVGQLFDIDAAYFFERITSHKTKVTQVSDVRPKGGLKIIFLLFGWLMKTASCKAAEKELNNLKEYCEQQEGAIS
ncbi:SRPBCC family protein [Thalassoglobus polymorphus]|uniref:Polyketide cyclase / dehydrase and lipid transport n=1 Tax=Thalassoglobus polymorphus TaxID=2527994 RepID=A0A517QKD0_9PLAN|nr:SRPBCC family protein [Thalassoglobus polymorphus]QDT32099.1 hypothetical protein Mal48_13400 [Thalassoglobus polymorphus]